MAKQRESGGESCGLITPERVVVKAYLLYVLRRGSDGEAA